MGHIRPPSGVPRGRPPKPGTKKWEEYQERIRALKGIEEPSAKAAHESDADIIKRIQDRFEILQQIAKAAALGNARSIIVSGAGGVGKTYTIENILDWAKEKHNIQYRAVHGIVTPVNLYKLLYENRFPNSVILLDDADQIFFNESSLSLLKAAMDTKKARHISWLAESKALKEDNVPHEFLFEGTIIFITNLDFQRIVSAGKSKLAEHLDALMTRPYYLDLKLHTPRELATWINYIVRKANILVAEHGLSREQQDEVLKYLTNNRDAVRKLSIRAAIQVGGMMKTSPKDWRRMADVLMQK